MNTRKWTNLLLSLIHISLMAGGWANRNPPLESDRKP